MRIPRSKILRFGAGMRGHFSEEYKDVVCEGIAEACGSSFQPPIASTRGATQSRHDAVCGMVQTEPAPGPLHDLTK